ncbi:hypothetical protein [Nocardioides sp.]|uniref:hypothetical protein n=1 Tax=Nocardioides sp. TaxID=35761 RepID=UPI0035671EFF
MTTIIGIIAAVVVVLIGFAVVAFYRSLAEERARSAEREAARLREVLDEVKDIAWTNREIAPDLATIIIDTIRTQEQSDKRRQLP